MARNRQRMSPTMSPKLSPSLQFLKQNYNINQRVNDSDYDSPPLKLFKILIFLSLKKLTFQQSFELMHQNTVDGINLIIPWLLD